MATFNVNVLGSFVSGTAASDTFNLSQDACTVLGLDGDDTFTSSNASFLSLDGGAGNDSFDFTVSTSSTLARGADGNDAVFIADGSRNIVSAMPVMAGLVSVAVPGR
jgi:Ca2+-binding RTX toxin-like protein